ncbi:NUDIX hydrolase [Tenacibaculum sp. UWU-22]|uniref:NUDIX hydrolase n=1 Tax=Tenacibaculum sp. UWU-22 TaxID=3234187 RepID=UPI0034DABB87
MYKVFVKNKPIIITDSEQKNKYPIYHFDQVSIAEIVYKLKNESIDGVWLYTLDVSSAWKQFKKAFKLVKAAGGLVENSEGEILFIYRSGKWEFPKGKIEKGEKIKNAAIREVEEESGVANLTVIKFLMCTYHVFDVGTKLILKKTSWYLMHTTYNQKLTPQTEEGITKAVFKNKRAIKNALKNTYANIIMVYQEYQKK